MARGSARDGQEAARAPSSRSRCRTRSRRSTAAGPSLVVDVREPNEFEQGHLPGAINVPRGLLELRADPELAVATRG